MKCVACGTELEAGALLCPNCGRVVSSKDVIRSKAQGGQLTKKEFYKLPGMKACRNNIRACAIILYFSAAMTVAAALFLDMLMASVIDAALLLALGLWLQFGKSRICAIIVLCYGVFNMAMVALQNGTIQGWLIPLAGAWAIAYTFKFHRLWSKYQKEGVVPDEAM
ncbi:MAG: zinc-ribbon domain-containing protein [Lachnospiraceae bacterium]|nr:zinc-ribbon domain-containing protein [Lachnospiraceae bacterium]